MLLFTSHFSKGKELKFESSSAVRIDLEILIGTQQKLTLPSTGSSLNNTWALGATSPSIWQSYVNLSSVNVSGATDSWHWWWLTANAVVWSFFSSQNSCDAVCDLCRCNGKVLPRQEGLQSPSFANGRFYPGTESVATADVNYCHWPFYCHSDTGNCYRKSYKTFAIFGTWCGREQSLGQRVNRRHEASLMDFRTYLAVEDIITITVRARGTCPATSSESTDTYFASV